MFIRGDKPLSLQKSIRKDLLILWLSISTVSLVLVALLLVLIRQSAGPQIARARNHASISCEALRAGAERLPAALPQATGVRPSPETLLGGPAILDLVLRDRPGMEGGFWQVGPGVVAYAFPTYDGTGIKRDPPIAELERIAATAQRALETSGLVTDVRPGLREAVVFSACPVASSPRALAAWTLTRVPLIGADVVNPLILAMSLLLCLVVVSGIWLSRMLGRWHLQSIDMQQKLAQAERLATLGRMSAGLAHEIRNPLGTMRMKVENALAAPADVREVRVAGALESVLSQSQRLESLVSSLLALTQPFRVERKSVPLRSFFDERMQAHAPAAMHGGIRLVTTVSADLDAIDPPPTWFDPEQLARALDNLLLNALAHTGQEGVIELGASLGAQRALRLWVADDGVGVPAELRDSLFEPFSTARTGGSGLGLALVREIVQAHGGKVALLETPKGARIEIELPWPTS